MALRIVMCFVITAIAAAPSSSEVPLYDTVVVGLGAAGTTAAATLAAAGRRVLALEAQGRVGGRVRTVAFGDGLVEEGAEWIHGVDKSRVYDAALIHNVSTITQSDDMDVYLSDGGEVDRPLINELMGFYSQIVDHASTKDEPLGMAITRKMKEHIYENYPDLLQDQDFVTELLEFLHQATNSHDASNDWNEVTSLSAYQELRGNQLTSWHRHGYKTFFEIMLNKYNGGPGLPNLHIKLDTEVTKILAPQHPHEKVVVECKDGRSYEAENVVVTVSLGVLKATHTSLFSPPLPEQKRTAIETMSIGVVDKIILSFEHPWWPRNTSVIGFIWKREVRKKVGQADYWTTKIFGASRPMGSGNTLTLWLSGNVAKEVETLSEEVVKRKAIELLQRFIGNKLRIAVPQPTDVIRSSWFRNPYTRGSYSFDGVRAAHGARAALAAPLADSARAPRVLFAGEAASRDHYSTVHGASETGHREASRILEFNSSNIYDDQEM